MKFFIGPSRVRIPPRTQTQQKRGASVNFVIIFLVVSRSFITVTTACCIRKKVTICAAYSLRWGKKLKNWKRENVKNALTGTHVFFRLGGMCCYSVIDKIVIFAMSWAWKKKKSEFPTELLWVRSYTRFMCNMRLAQWQELLKAVNKWEKYILLCYEDGSFIRVSNKHSLVLSRPRLFRVLRHLSSLSGHRPGDEAAINIFLLFC